MRRSLGGVSGTDTLLVKQNTRIPPYVRTDLMFLNKIRRSKRRMPRQLRKLLQRLVSENPLNDLSVLVWLMFLAALPFRGFPLLFTFFANYFMALILGMLISSRRPWQLDRRLKPQVRVSGSAFPCLELWLAAVTFLSIGTAYPSPASVLGLLALFCLLLYTRLATLAYFTVQLLGSCLLGCAGWAACEVLKATVLRNGVHRQVILVGAILTVMAFLGHVAYLAERNQSAVLAVPKAECECTRASALELGHTPLGSLSLHRFASHGRYHGPPSGGATA